MRSSPDSNAAGTKSKRSVRTRTRWATRMRSLSIVNEVRSPAAAIRAPTRSHSVFDDSLGGVERARTFDHARIEAEQARQRQRVGDALALDRAHDVVVHRGVDRIEGGI